MTTSTMTAEMLRKTLHQWLPEDLYGVTDEEAVIIIEILLKKEIRELEHRVTVLKKHLANFGDLK